MTSLIGLALSLVCSFSAPQCKAADGVKFDVQPIAPGAFAQYDFTHRTITVRPDVTHPAVLAAALSHELQHAIDFDQTNPTGPWKRPWCEWLENRGYDEQRAEWAWFSSTFGAPILQDPQATAFGNLMYAMPNVQPMLVHGSCMSWLP